MAETTVENGKVKCQGTIRKGGLVGEECRRALLVKDPELGWGIPCDRSPDFHPLRRILRDLVESGELDDDEKKALAAILNQKENGREKMVIEECLSPKEEHLLKEMLKTLVSSHRYEARVVLDVMADIFSREVTYDFQKCQKCGGDRMLDLGYRWETVSTEVHGAFGGDKVKTMRTAHLSICQTCKALNID